MTPPHGSVLDKIAPVKHARCTPALLSGHRVGCGGVAGEAALAPGCMGDVSGSFRRMCVKEVEWIWEGCGGGRTGTLGRWSSALGAVA